MSNLILDGLLPGIFLLDFPWRIYSMEHVYPIHTWIIERHWYAHYPHETYFMHARMAKVKIVSFSIHFSFYYERHPQCVFEHVLFTLTINISTQRNFNGSNLSHYCRNLFSYVLRYSLFSLKSNPSSHVLVDFYCIWLPQFFLYCTYFDLSPDEHSGQGNRLSCSGEG